MTSKAGWWLLATGVSHCSCRRVTLIYYMQGACLFICQEHYRKSTGQNWLKFGGTMCNEGHCIKFMVVIGVNCCHGDR